MADEVIKISFQRMGSELKTNSYFAELKSKWDSKRGKE